VKVGVLYSGGKDSTYAAHLAAEHDSLACLITVYPSTDSSYMFHFPNARLTALQSEAMNLSHVTIESAGIKEEELRDLKAVTERAKRKFGLQGIYTGALASVYQKSRVEKICADLGLDCVSPLWGTDPELHLRRLVSERYRVIVVGVSALGLDKTWLGRTLDEAAVDDLVRLAKRNRFHAGLEGGEGETFVVDAPLFSKKIEVVSATRHWHGDSGYYEITRARLVPRSG